MEIFKTINLVDELKDYLSTNTVKLGQLSCLGAGNERWFQFEMALLIMEKWERIINKPWDSWHLYAEVKSTGEKSPIDLVVAPENEDGIKWDEAGIIELKHVGFPVFEPGKAPKKKFEIIKRQIEEDYKKREHLNCEMITIALAYHFAEDDQEKSPTIRNQFELNLREFRDYMANEGYFLPKNLLDIPYVHSSYRGYNYGFYSCGVWLKKS